jgi:transposase
MSQSPKVPLPPELWDTLPKEVQELVLAMQARIEQLEGRVQELEARLGQNSQNSSSPPSADPPGFQRPRRDRGPSGRQRGGQPGHPGRHRIQYPEAQVDEVVDLHPSQCDHCGIALEGAAAEEKKWCHQVVDLPEVRPRVTEYRLHNRRCPGCGKRAQPPWPDGVPRHGRGPRLQATAALLTGRYRLSRREAQQLLGDLYQVEFSLGSWSELEGTTAQALTPVVEEVARQVQRSGVVNLDETGWREENHKGWLWTGVAPQVSLFRVEASRSSAVVEELLGEDFTGVVGSDRYGAYHRIPLQQRALCLAHVKRNFQGLVDRGGEGARVGHWGVRELGRVFALWHRFRDGSIDRPGLQAGLRPIKARFAKLLEYGLWGEDHQAETLCWQLKKHWAALWTFSRVKGVEPTNNAAERALRPAVLWRKGSFGTQSQRGSRFAEKMLTVAASCRQQGRNLLSFLVEACKAALVGTSPPSLLPSPAPA